MNAASKHGSTARIALQQQASMDWYQAHSGLHRNQAHTQKLCGRLLEIAGQQTAN
jgi:hypothetical protein